MLLTLSMCLGMFSACTVDDSDDDKDDTTPPAATELTITSDFVLTTPAAPTDSENYALNTVFLALNAIGISCTPQDDSVEAPKNEIIIGNTNRSQTQDAKNEMNGADYIIKVSGDADNGYKIVLAANNAGGIKSAAQYFVKNYINSDKAGTVPVDLLYTYTCTDVNVAGVPLSEFTIVYAQESATVSDKNIQAAKYVDTVELFADQLEMVIGKRPTIVADSSRVPSGTKAILFGKSDNFKDDDAAYTTAFASEGAYTVTLSENGNVILAGNNACSVLAAGEAFADALRDAPTGLNELNLSGEKELIKVACIGDSITFGTNSSDTSMMNYPVYLQRMLGYDYYVEKYGAPSHSLIETDNQSFLKHGYFNQSVSAAPDVVIVMLGTNDCRTQKWADSAYKDWRDGTRMESFLASGEKLINAYRGANEDVQIIWTTCPTVPQDAWLGSDWTQRIERYGNPGISNLASTFNCNLIDVFTYTEEHPEIFHISDDIPEAERGDGLHPQNETYGILAEGIYEMIKDFIKKPQ